MIQYYSIFIRTCPGRELFGRDAPTGPNCRLLIGQDAEGGQTREQKTPCKSGPRYAVGREQGEDAIAGAKY